MSLQIIIREKTYTNFLILVVALLVCFVQAANAWEIDLTKRQKQMMKRGLASEPSEQKPPDLIEKIFGDRAPTQEIVIMHTDKGFVPKTVNLLQGNSYIIHIVNVDEKEKNISFILDAFSEHHATYFGKETKFTMTPKKDGIFSFQSPETAHEGRIVVYPPAGGRLPASQGETAKVE